MFSFDKDKWCRAGRHRERSERPRDARDRMHPFLCRRECVSSPHLVSPTSTLDAWSPGAQVQGYRTAFLQFSWIRCSVCRPKPRCPQLRRSLVFGRGDFLNGGTEVCFLADCRPGGCSGPAPVHQQVLSSRRPARVCHVPSSAF